MRFLSDKNLIKQRLKQLNLGIVNPWQTYTYQSKNSALNYKYREAPLTNGEPEEKPQKAFAYLTAKYDSVKATSNNG
jgi:hypothetical protein